MKTTKTISVAIAYISDVEGDVDSCMEECLKLNTLLSDTGYSFSIRKWKHLFGGHGRPQEQINKQLFESCDIFIGVLGQKWGKPTGVCDCGFKEEYEFVEKRWEKEKKPVMAVFKKKIDNSQIEDELKVFINSIESNQWVISYNDKADLITKVRDYLIAHSYKVIRLPVEPNLAQTSTPSTTKEQSTEQVNISAKRGFKKEGLDDLICDLLGVHKKIEHLDDYNKTRLHIFSAANFYESNTSDVFDNHSLHKLYVYRDKVDFTGIELKTLFRTILSDRYDSKTGWFWLKHINSRKLNSVIVYFALSDPNEDARLGALSYLVRKWQNRYQKIVLTSLKDNSTKVVERAIEILGDFGNSNCLEIIDIFLSSSKDDISNKAWVAKLKILARHDQNEMIAFVLSSGDKSKNASDVLSQSVHSLSDDNLQKLLSSEENSIVNMAAIELAKRSNLSKNELLTYIGSDNSELRGLAIERLLQLGEMFDAEQVLTGWPSEKLPFGLLFGNNAQFRDDTVNKVLSTLPKEDLNKKISWMAISGPAAYYIYHSKGYNPIDSVISDLDSNFSKIKKNFIDDYENKIKQEVAKNTNSIPVDIDRQRLLDETAQEAVKKITTDISQHDEYIIGNYTYAALRVLNDRNDSSAIKYARRFLNNGDRLLQELCVDILSKGGCENDTEELIQLAIRSHGSLKNKSAGAAIKVAGEKRIYCLDRFMSSGDYNLINNVYTCALEYKLKKYIPNAKEFLSHDNENIRINSLAYLVKALKNNELVKLLNEYVSKTTYYYDVVCWLDRTIFSRPVMRNIFKKLLYNKIK